MDMVKYSEQLCMGRTRENNEAEVEQEIDPYYGLQSFNFHNGFVLEEHPDTIAYGVRKGLHTLARFYSEIDALRYIADKIEKYNNEEV